MKKIFAGAVLACAACLSLVSCASSPTADAPAWFPNHRTAFPDSEFLAQRGSGTSAEKAETDAASALARYFQTNVSANLSTTMKSVTGGNGTSEETTVIDDVRVQSEVKFFALEYTDAYYFKKEKKWYSVAYLNREKAWTQYKPQVDSVKKTFDALLQNAETEKDPLARLSRYKTAWGAGKTLLEKLEYARILSPQKEAAYTDARDRVAQIPARFEEAKSRCSVFVSVQGDHNGILASSLSKAFAGSGFTVAKSKSEAAYTAEAFVEDNASGSDPISIQPAVSLKIVGRGGNSVWSHEASASEKPVSYEAKTARKKAYPKLAQELKTGVRDSLSASFRL